MTQILEANSPSVMDDAIRALKRIARSEPSSIATMLEIGVIPKVMKALKEEGKDKPIA